MDRIFNIVGPSGSGKTTIAKELEKLGYNIIKSYTTREPREPNEWGHTFVDEEAWAFRENTIAEKELYDCGYWATKDQYQGKGTSIYVVDPSGAKQVQENVKDAEVITIFLMADKLERRHRLLKRYDAEAYYQGFTWLPNEIIERIEKDIDIFSKCKCDYVVDANRRIEEVLTDVKEIIKEKCKHE